MSVGQQVAEESAGCPHCSGAATCHESRQLSQEHGVTILLSLHCSQEPPTGQPLGAKESEKYKVWASWRPNGQGGIGEGRSGCRPLGMTPPARTSHRKTSDTTKTNTQQGRGCAAYDGWWRPLRKPGRTARWGVYARAARPAPRAPPHPTPGAVAPALLGPSRGCPPAEAHPYWLRLSWGVLRAGLHSTPSQPSPRGPSLQMEGVSSTWKQKPPSLSLQTQNCDVLKVFS